MTVKIRKLFLPNDGAFTITSELNLFREIRNGSWPLNRVYIDFQRGNNFHQAE